jgi:hypothetical protein
MEDISVISKWRNSKMIVYEAIKKEFLQHVDQDELVTHILEEFHLKLAR